MNSAVRTGARPPLMKLLPRHWPVCRVQGAKPTSAATRFRSRFPSSCSTAVRVRAIVGPTPGTEIRSASFLRHAEDRSTAASIARSIRTCSCSRASRTCRTLSVMQDGAWLARCRSDAIIHSPPRLVRSRVGPASVLRRHSTAVVPVGLGVGANLQDPMSAAVFYYRMSPGALHPIMRGDQWCGTWRRPTSGTRGLRRAACRRNGFRTYEPGGGRSERPADARRCAAIGRLPLRPKGLASASGTGRIRCGPRTHV